MSATMKTICIESTASAAIGWGVRYNEDDQLYSTLSQNTKDVVRQHNLQRFQKKVIVLWPWDLANVMHEDNNIQIVSNTWITNIPGRYHDPENHVILSKTWIVHTLFENKLDKYLPKSRVIKKWEVGVDKIYNTIQSNFPLWSKVVIKHAWIDGNGSGVWMVNYTRSGLITKEQIMSLIEKFSKSINGWGKNVFGYDFLLQEYISDILWEWSITFSIQNKRITTLGLANNVVVWGEYFGSTNIFPYMNEHQIQTLTNQLESDLVPLLYRLQHGWVRWNIGFDLFFQEKEWEMKPYILECNGIHRMTGSLIPNNFAYNTKNKVFVGVPIAQKYVAEKYASLSPRSLVPLADTLAWFWTKDGEAQIMNIKCEWSERWHPVLWIASAGPTQEQLFQLFYDSTITNEKWIEYIKDVFKKMACSNTISLNY